MEIKELEIFLCVANARSLAKASKKLYMSPQGISKVIKKLETEVDSELFLRLAGGMELSETGDEFSKYAMEAVHAYNDMLSKIASIEMLRNKKIHLLSAYGVLRLVTPECVNRFKQVHPDFDFEYREYPDRIVEDYFSKKTGNVAFSIGPFDEEVLEIANVMELKSFPIKLLVYDTHPLASLSSVTINDLRGERLYIENRDFKINKIILDKCKEAGFSPDIAFETSGFSLCHKMVSAKKGISVTVDFMYDDMKESNLKMIPFAGEGFDWKISMLTRKEDKESYAVNTLRDFILDWMDMIDKGEFKR